MSQDNEIENLPPMSADMDDLPPLPDSLPEEELPPLPENIELPPMPQPELAPPPQPAAPSGKMPIVLAILSSALAIYGAVDAWQAKQEAERAQIAASKNVEAAQQAEQKAQAAQKRYLQILNCASTVSAYQSSITTLNSMMENNGRKLESCNKEIAELKDKCEALRAQKDELEKNN